MELCDEDPKSWVMMVHEESSRNSPRRFNSDDRIPYEAIRARYREVWNLF